MLLELYREARGRLVDPVLAWADVAGDPARAHRYQAARGRGGLERVSWEEAAEIFAAAHVHAIGRWGPDRIAGVSGNPAGPMASHPAGARFVSLLGGVVLTPGNGAAGADPRAREEPEGTESHEDSEDWRDTDYLVMWGTGLPADHTRAARPPGHKVVAVSAEQPGDDQADEWLTPAPGTDAALAMAMGHVVLKEFFVNSPVGYFVSYAKRFTDLPYLVALDAGPVRGHWQPGKLVTAADLPTHDMLAHAAFKPMVIDERTASPAVPDGALGHRFDDDAGGRWSLADVGIDPLLSLARSADFTVDVVLPRFDEPAATLVRPVPVRRLGAHLVTTVYDLMLAQYGVAEGPTRYGDPDTPYTPAWQESLTGVPAHAAARIAREFARNAAVTQGRSTIVAAASDWFHGDTIDRAILALAMLTGCQGVAGGGRVQFGGRGEARPITGWAQLAFGLDWARPPREMPAAVYRRLHGDAGGASAGTPEDLPVDLLSGPTGAGRLAGMNTDDLLALASRLGWLPSYPTFDRNPLDLVDEAEAARVEPAAYVVDELAAGRLRFACDDPDDERSRPRVLTVWHPDLVGADPVGADCREADPGTGWPEFGELDLLCALGSPATGSSTDYDLLLPATVWWETHEAPPVDLAAGQGEAATEWGVVAVLAAAFSRLAGRHLGVRRDLVAAPLRPGTVEAMVAPRGVVQDWSAGECEPIPGRTLPRLVVVERDYAAVADRLRALGPFADSRSADVPPDAVRAAEDRSAEDRSAEDRPGAHIERLEPWPTLTGRQHFYLDHDWFLELGENMPTYRPPLDLAALLASASASDRGEEPAAAADGLRVTVRYLTARDEWSIQAEYDGPSEHAAMSPVWPLTPESGPAAWLAESDAARLGIVDGDRVEVGNSRGRVRARAVVSARTKAGTVYLQRSQRHPDAGLLESAAPVGEPQPALFKPTHLLEGHPRQAFRPGHPGSSCADEASILRKHR